MDYHTITNKMAAIAVHLRMADTLCSNAGSIDQIRCALNIALDVGEACGKKILKEVKK